MSSLNDLMLEFFAAATGNASSTGTDATLPAVATVPSVTGSTVRAAGTQNAPGAGVAIATTAALDDALYKVRIETFIAGTTVAALESINMRFKINAVATTSNDVLLNGVPGTTGATAVDVHEFNYAANDGDTLSVVANAAATASSIYSATIHCTKLVYL